MAGVDEVKTRLKELMDKRDKMENEIAFLQESLPAGPQPIKLVDEEGFPRNDIDVVAVRTTMNKLAMLQNDHKAVMNAIQAALAELHALQTGSAPSATNVEEQKTASSDAETAPSRPVLRPFYLVDNVWEDSPANQARLRIGDRIMQFGSITYENVSDQALSELVQKSINQQIDVIVHRNPEGLLNLRLVPMQWSGRGLLGCHLTPINRRE